MRNFLTFQALVYNLNDLLNQMKLYTDIVQLFHDLYLLLSYHHNSNDCNEMGKHHPMIIKMLFF